MVLGTHNCCCFIRESKIPRCRNFTVFINIYRIMQTWMYSSKMSFSFWRLNTAKILKMTKSPSVKLFVSIESWSNLTQSCTVQLQMSASSNMIWGFNVASNRPLLFKTFFLSIFALIELLDNVLLSLFLFIIWWSGEDKKDSDKFFSWLKFSSNIFGSVFLYNMNI